MTLDVDGYGFPDDDRTVGRLISDIRTLSPAGVERAARGWDINAGEHSPREFEAAERRAQEAIERAGRGPIWEEARRTLFGLTESGAALVSWKVEHGDIGHKAERAAFAAALGLIASDLIGEEDLVTLLRPMAEALPWLLPGFAPAPLGLA